MEKSIFKKIIDKEIPAHILYEDEHFLVFLDNNPEAPGHSLVIPKEEVRWVWDTEHYQEYWNLVRKIAKTLQRVFKTEWIISKVVGDEVPHAHIHLFPGGVTKDGTEKDFETIAGVIKKELHEEALL